MATSLAFRTPPGAVDIPAGQSKKLAEVDVHQFERIRVVAFVGAGSTGPVRIPLIIAEGNEAIGHLDELILQPRSEVTKVYEVPGTTLMILAEVISGSGSSAVGMFVYGFANWIGS
jgi:hypothetical protein